MSRSSDRSIEEALRFEAEADRGRAAGEEGSSLKSQI